MFSDLGTTPIDIFFYAFAVLTVIFSLVVVLSKNPITSAFSLVAVFFFLAGTYVLLNAHFIAALQILVYAGAVMVLFVFVIMLLNADLRQLDIVKNKPLRAGIGVVCFILLSFLIKAITQGQIAQVSGGFTPEKIQEYGGNVQIISELMFSDYILPFEITSILLLVGIVGSVSLAKREGRKMQPSSLKFRGKK